MCILFSSGSQSYSMEGFGGKKGDKEICTVADQSGKGQSCWRRWVLRVWSRRKVKFTHLGGRSKRWKERRRADPMCVHGTRIPLAHLSVCPLTHIDSAGCPGIPHYLLLSVCTNPTVWLIHVKDGLSFQYLQLSRTLAGVSPPGVEQIWFCLACWSGQELNLEVARLFTTLEGH